MLLDSDFTILWHILLDNLFYQDQYQDPSQRKEFVMSSPVRHSLGALALVALLGSAGPLAYLLIRTFSTHCAVRPGGRQPYPFESLVYPKGYSD